MLRSQPGLRVSPVAVLLAVSLFGAVVLFDLSALLSGIDLVAEVGRWIMATGLVVGVLVLTVALVDLTATISGTPTHRTRAAVTSALGITVVLFLFVWWARVDRTVHPNIGLWLIELFGFAAGAGAVWFARDVGRLLSVTPASAPPLLGLGDL